MSHSFDSTLLQRMGFKDEDRKTPAHDRACIEIAVNPQALIDALSLPGDQAATLLEVPLQKGEGKYASTVGFIDAIVEWSAAKKVQSCTRRHRERPFVLCADCTEEDYRSPRAMLVEVKTKIVGIGDLLRQMNLYREYKREHGGYPATKIDPFVVWSLEPGDVQFSALLLSQGYRLLVGPTLADLRGDR